MPRTQFEVGYNDCAYALNTWRDGCCPDHALESKKDYARRLKKIVEEKREHHDDYDNGCLTALNMYLGGGVALLKYKGGWDPSRPSS